MTAALEVRDLRRRFGPVQALGGVSFSVERGQICGFIGPNGAGKTTAMRICATLEAPDAGDVLIEGRSGLSDPHGARQRLGFLPDDWQPPAHTLVWEHLDFHARARGLRSSARKAAIDDAVRLTGLEPLLEKPCQGLSRGMRQRVGLSAILLHDPRVLLLDEPASGLDPRARVKLREVLQALAARGKAILVSSHILSELEEMCQAVVILERGELKAAGAVQEIRRGLRRDALYRLRCLQETQVVASFLASQPGVADVAPHPSAHHRGGLRFRLAGGDGAAAALLGAAVAAGLRPVELVQEEDALEAVFLSLTAGEVQ